MLHFVTSWMDLENIMLSEISQSEKEKYHDFTHMWNLMNRLNKRRKWGQTRRLQDDSKWQGETRGWRDWSKGKKIHGHGQQCGDCWGERSIRELNSNGKNTIKIKLKNRNKK